MSRTPPAKPLDDEHQRAKPRTTLTGAITALPQAMRRALGFVFSFEAALVLFLFAGVYKDEPFLAWLPVDVTAGFFALSVLAGLCLAWRRGLVFIRYSAQLVWLYGALTAWALLSLLWSPSIIYAHDKALYICTLVFWPLAACALIIAPERVRYQRFFLLVLVFSGWVALQSLVFIASNILAGRSFVFVEALSGTYLSLGRVVGSGFIILATWAMYIERRNWLRLLLGGLAMCYLALLLVIGGRAPLIAAVMAGLVLLIGTRPRLGRTPRQLLVQILAVIAACMIAVGIYQAAEDRPVWELPSAVARMSALVEDGIQSNRRFYHYSQTLHYVDNNPWLGQGIGSWPVVVGYGDVRAFPHNILLEIWFELGLPGLLLFGALVATALAVLAPWRRLRASPMALLALALFISAAINASVSGDLNDNRLLFATLGLLLLASTDYRQQNAEQAAANKPH
jgi:O-antigen ligase